ncbi:Stp1/IreP family PP2C-type Ser/Thr phosphatase [Bacillus sp. 3H-10]|uniref:protein-serine/threonine phosphatase n=2 Tax=Bacillus aquiflavi TaxID=2672567 RepID=A0A6B3W4K1_9BACI|nr:Stp1/IreP family PP2C-type Ser/Thr phosphatase [Bacillus aquiflavi]NEY82394.1 Stp1/IreP family PP2C-type Ser/Thr phosphatase [Bacillus aquiflavi]
MKAVYMTDRGKIRPHNEDSGGVFINIDKDYLAIVADGMGGHRAGDVASEMTLTTLKEWWKSTKEITTPEIAEQWLKEKINNVNNKLFTHSKNNQECQGMGTTLVAAICTKRFSTIANIGDSRCYILNETGLQQLTEDHSLVNELVRSGQITKEDAEHHPRKNVLLRALGTEDHVETDIKTITFEEDDILLLCSDGLSNKVSDQEINDELMKNISIEEKAANLIKMANDNGGEDNITLVIVEYRDDHELGDEQC